MTLSMSGLVLALSDDPYPRQSGLQPREMDQLFFLRRSPMENAPSSSRRSGLGLGSYRDFSQQSRETKPSAPQERTPSPVARKPYAVGVVQAAHPAQGFIYSGMHGEWETKPKPNIPSVAKLQHPDKVCIGGSCAGPKGVLALDVVGKKVTTKIDSRAGGTVQMAEHEDMTSQPRWKTFSPGNYLSHTTTAKDNNLARHHTRLDGPGKLTAEGSM
ncbi:MAG: hypothetical protein GOMPHAMPRED_003806 [Gomphillus americanus]|uniref:Uncharacterized protein n=1 Tax=Gomphillus americanus TaxID=1940652 RepID=A0A8H3FI69_9LECA|nr:MAG: hypothetical protein GOMPHAMPRED_003806 [Gomphillus americanus]